VRRAEIEMRGNIHARGEESRKDQEQIRIIHARGE